MFKVDFRQIDPTILRGQQSYPIAIGGRLFVTTNDNNVFALDATDGKVIWRYTPPNRAVFANFGIRANRGVAACDGKLFLLTLDMHIVSLDQGTGRVIRRVPIAGAVPGAGINYGYSETSAPMCANGRLVLGAAGSEYGVRGFVMAYTYGLKPAWANPFWTIPPDLHGWRRPSRLVGGGVVWTPTTIDAVDEHALLRHRVGDPALLAAAPAGSQPAHERADRDRPPQRASSSGGSSRSAATSGRTTRRSRRSSTTRGSAARRAASSRSATMEGVWYAYDARTGAPIYQRVKVIDRTEHPPLRPGKPVVVFPSSLGGLNYSPASYDPDRNIIVNAAAETSAVLTQKKLTPTEKRRKLVLGDVFLGLEIGNFGTVNPNWKDHGSISAISVATGRRVWKFNTPEPERGGVTTTESGLGFAGGGDGVVRAFDLRNGKVLWTFQTSHAIASGPTVYSVGGKEYVAITVGGTPTSSNGGTASELHVFALGGSKRQDPPPPPPPPAPSFARAAPDAKPLVNVLRTPAATKGFSLRARDDCSADRHTGPARAPRLAGELVEHSARDRPPRPRRDGLWRTRT